MFVLSVFKERQDLILCLKKALGPVLKLICLKFKYINHGALGNILRIAGLVKKSSGLRPELILTLFSAYSCHQQLLQTTASD